jgi:hypothetical protein
VIDEVFGNFVTVEGLIFYDWVFEGAPFEAQGKAVLRPYKF